MQDFLVHIKRHCGWHQASASGETFAEAAVAAVTQTCKQFGLDLDAIPHSARFEERDGTSRVTFYEESEREVFGGDTKPGDFWFSQVVRQGKAEDCPNCGGTGNHFYDPFRLCLPCGGAKTRQQKSSAQPA